MVDIKDLRENYFLRDDDPEFSRGRRSRLFYACESLTTHLTKVNSAGPDPHEYLEYAKRDLVSQDSRGAINALGNAKRSIHLAIEKLLNLWGLQHVIRNLNFPQRIELIKEIGVLPTQLVLNLNHERNLMEHEYAQVSLDRALEIVELADLFITVVYQYFKHTIIGVYIGEDGTTGCQEWFIDLSKTQVVVREVPTTRSVMSPSGPVHYNIQRPIDVVPKATVPIRDSNRQEWLPYLDLFAYCTRHTISRLPKADSRGEGVYIGTPSLYFPEEDEPEA